MPLLFQIRWTKTAGSVSDRFQDSSVFNETLNIAKILRNQGGRYYCKAENGLGSPAIKSIRVDVYCKQHTRTQTHTKLAAMRGSRMNGSDLVGCGRWVSGLF